MEGTPHEAQRRRRDRRRRCEESETTGTPGSVARVLDEVRVGGELRRRERIQVPERFGGGAGRRPALPGPQGRPAGELAEPDQIGAAMTLPQQLAAALIEDELQGEIGP